jgi:membrane-associated phospholipid phosphatase
MRPAELLALAYFLSFGAAALALRRSRARWPVTLGWASAGSLVASTAWLAPTMVRDWWLLTAVPLAYWAPAPLTVTTDARLEGWLLAVDRRLGLTRGGPTSGGLLELAYLLVYPLVPAGLLAVVASRPGLSADYCLALLTAVLPCYGLLPLLPTRPPRALLPSETAAPSSATVVRQANVRMLDACGNSWNTLPSGHAAGAAAVAVMVARSGSPLAPVFLLLAVGIALGTVRGRYHYAVDTILGVALGVLAGIGV